MNYLKEIKSDICCYLEQNDIAIEDVKNNFDYYYDIFSMEDEITGNTSGSYTINTYQAECNIAHNLLMLKTACDEYGITPPLEDPEKCDVIIRCSYLYMAMEELIEELD